jgi:hypothetical protein
VSAVEPDEIGPWAVLTFEHAESASPVVTTYGPMPRSAAEASP